MELLPCGRFEWERIIRRCTNLDTHEFAVAMAMASYADLDGTHIFPGTERLARVAKMSRRKALDALVALRQAGLIERTLERQKNGRKGGVDVYRLTIPSDILGRFEMLDPDEERVHVTTLAPVGVIHS